MLPLLLLLLILQLPCAVCQPQDPVCFDVNDRRDSKDGDVLLTAFLPVCLYSISKLPTQHEDRLHFRR